MRNIYKLKLNPWQHQYEMPRDAKLLHVAWQGNDVCVWYEFAARQDGTPTWVMVKRVIKVFPTGISFDEKHLEYVGSAVSKDLVFHVYDGREESDV